VALAGLCAAVARQRPRPARRAAALAEQAPSSGRPMTSATAATGPTPGMVMRIS
jgi:hypothetical protein